MSFIVFLFAVLFPSLLLAVETSGGMPVVTKPAETVPINSASDKRHYFISGINYLYGRDELSDDEVFGGCAHLSTANPPGSGKWPAVSPMFFLLTAVLIRLKKLKQI